MFDRYTIAARRVVFFARASAGEAGAREIDTDHLLWGLLRDSEAWQGLLDPTAAGQLLLALESAPPRGPASPYGDMLLSGDARNALAFAAEEANRLGESNIGCRHILVGLLRVPESRAARLLAPQGVTLEGVRRKAEGAL